MQLYSNLKFLQFTDHIHAINQRQVVAPVHVRIKPINWCNHDFWYCAYRSSDLKLGDDMDEADTISSEKMSEIVEGLI